MFAIPPEPSKEEISLLRTTFLNKFESEGALNSFDQRDINRFKTEDDYLRRFLMHHDNDQKLALEMAVDTLKWRKENGVNDITEHTVDRSFFDKKVLYTHNRDIDGCKMLIFNVCHHTKDGGDPEKIKAFLIYWIERLEREEKGKWITVFFDMRETGYKNMDMVFIQYMINLFKCYYPWILNYIIVYDMPWLLNAMWKIIKGWLPPKSIGKIKFVDKKTIQTFVSADECLVGWGGKDDYVFSFEPERRRKASLPLANGDLDAKKVHFAVGSGSTPTDSNPPSEVGSSLEASGSVLESKLSSSSHIQYCIFRDAEGDFFVRCNTKFQVEPSEELLFLSSGVGSTASILFTNNSPNRFAFKIKTTSPDKFRVRPSVGTVEPKGRVEVSVAVSELLAPALLVRDKFLVIAIPTARETVTQHDFAEIAKTTNKLDVFEVKLRVGLANSESQDPVGNHVPSCVPPGVSLVLANKLDQLMTRQTVMEEQLGSLRRLLYVIFFLMVAILFVFVIATSNLASNLLAHSNRNTREL